MAAKKAKIIKTKHKGPDKYILDLGKTRNEARYRNTRNAAVGAVRHYRDWLKANYGGVVEVTYPDERKRTGWILFDGHIYLSPFSKPKTTKRK